MCLNSGSSSTTDSRPDPVNPPAPAKRATKVRIPTKVKKSAQNRGLKLLRAKRPYRAASVNVNSTDSGVKINR